MAKLIKQVAFYLPKNIVLVDSLKNEHLDWNIDETLKKTGVKQIHQTLDQESTVDMAYSAAAELLSSLDREDWPDALLFCTQTPDFQIPQCSTILQNRLGLPTTIYCLDINLGCSGFVYSLSVAHSIIRAGLATKVLLITADSYSKIINPDDKKSFLLFSDGAAASLIGDTSEDPVFIFGSDGGKYDAIIYPHSGTNGQVTNREFTSCMINQNGCFEMDGYAVFLFTLSVVVEEIKKLLEKAKLTIEEIDKFVFHQASFFVLDSIRKKLNIPIEKMIIDIEDVGNTTSSSVPIAIARAVDKGEIKDGDKIFLFAFGIGLSWGGCVITY